MSITPREREVLYWISHGYSRKQIADKIYLSPHTINDYMKNLLAKTQASNAAQLIRIAFESDLLHTHV